MESVISLIFLVWWECSEKSAFSLKAIWVITVFDILPPRTFTSCQVSNNHLETWACGNELSDDLEDAKDCMLISDAITKLSFSDPKAVKGCKHLIPTITKQPNFKRSSLAQTHFSLHTVYNPFRSALSVGCLTSYAYISFTSE